MVTKVQTNVLEVIEELAREITRTSNGAYGTHFRRIVRVLPPDVADPHAWLASLDDSAVVELARRLEAVEGKPRPHFTAAVKRARAIALQKRTIDAMPPTFAEALRWAMERQGVSQSELARRVGVNESAVRIWLRGSKLPRSRTVVTRLEEALELPANSLAARLPRFGKQPLGVKGARYPGYSRTFLRVAALARYGKPWADLSPDEREALRREDEERWTRLSNRQERTRQARRAPFALPFDAWPGHARSEWLNYEQYASSPLASKARNKRAIKGEPVASRVLRRPTLEKEHRYLELFYGYCVNVRSMSPGALGFHLLTDVKLLNDYLEWRIERYEGNIPGLTSTDVAFINLVKKFYRNYVKAIGLNADLEGLRELEERIRLGGIDETHGYHAVEPLLDTPSPLYWLKEGLVLMLRDVAGQMGGNLLAPRSSSDPEAAHRALALYRDAVLFWLMAAHPLRAKHYYEARLDVDQFRKGGDFAPGKGHVERKDGTYYLAYRKREFKNAAGQVFLGLADEDLVEFPLAGLDHPLLFLEVGGARYALNDVFHVYLHEVHPRLVEVLRRSGPFPPLFPGLEKENQFRKTFRNRSAYVAAVPGVPPYVLPFGPHSVRHIVATEIVKATGSFEAAANVLLDSIQMVQQHYARFAPRDRYRHGWESYSRAGGNR
ncbi:helix-turn-helix domain-containing protein [Thermus sp.]|uniref:helix-turn-helix domain-containing protein n=1 Tax=Thermus sp. TaxID=275 RepID=UPI003D13767F